ncbi:hypothetical protein ACFL59_09775 [Planctomycetota bacterium]
MPERLLVSVDDAKPYDAVADELLGHLQDVRCGQFTRRESLSEFPFVAQEFLRDGIDAIRSGGCDVAPEDEHNLLAILTSAVDDKDEAVNFALAVDERVWNALLNHLVRECTARQQLDELL